MTDAKTYVLVEESLEAWSEFHLSDGSVIRAKFTFSGAIKDDKNFDDNGKPNYQFTGVIIIGIVTHAEPKICAPTTTNSGNA